MNLKFNSRILIIAVPEAPILTVTPCKQVATGTKLNLTCESSIQKVETFTFYSEPSDPSQATVVSRESNTYEVEPLKGVTSYHCTVEIQGNTMSSHPSDVTTVTVVGKLKVLV